MDQLTNPEPLIPTRHRETPKGQGDGKSSYTKNTRHNDDEGRAKCSGGAPPSPLPQLESYGLTFGIRSRATRVGFKGTGPGAAMSVAARPPWLNLMAQGHRTAPCGHRRLETAFDESVRRLVTFVRITTRLTCSQHVGKPRNVVLLGCRDFDKP